MRGRATRGFTNDLRFELFAYSYSWLLLYVAILYTHTHTQTQLSARPTFLNIGSHGTQAVVVCSWPPRAECKIRAA